MEVMLMLLLLLLLLLKVVVMRDVLLSLVLQMVLLLMLMLLLLLLLLIIVDLTRGRQFVFPPDGIGFRRQRDERGLKNKIKSHQKKRKKFAAKNFNRFLLIKTLPPLLPLLPVLPVPLLLEDEIQTFFTVLS